MTPRKTAARTPRPCSLEVSVATSVAILAVSFDMWRMARLATTMADLQTLAFPDE